MQYSTLLKKISLSQIQNLMKETGKFQISHFRKNAPGLGEEKVEREYVSRIDTESEERLKKGLKKIVPEAAFYGEESVKEKGELTWVVDPVDGTTNYLSGVDQWSISVALVHEENPVLGVVYKPITNEFFYSKKGEGAFHNKKRLTLKTSFLLKQSLLGTGFPYRSYNLKDSFFKCAEEALYASRGIRRFGSAALDLSYVAAGYLQGFWESDLEPYDVAAALLFLSETACLCTEFNGAPYHLWSSRTLVAGFPGVHGELKQIVDNHYKQCQ